MILREGIYFFSLLIALSALANPRLAAAADLRKVTFSYSAVSMTWYPVKVALEKGFFRSEGVEPQLIQMNGNVATVALANGYIDFSLNISPVLNGAMQGLGTKLVAALNSRPLFALVVRPEINAPNDLKGKVFAVSSFGNTQAILTEKHLQHLGLKKGEYQLLAMGATPARIAALEKNIAQGSLMPLPTNVQLENKGYRLLGNTAEIVINPIAGLGVHEDKIKKDPDLIKRVLRASLRSLQLLQANAKDTVKTLMDSRHRKGRAPLAGVGQARFQQERHADRRRSQYRMEFHSAADQENQRTGVDRARHDTTKRRADRDGASLIRGVIRRLGLNATSSVVKLI
jgi:NitT/TauT family transport system substrate-binding protein